MAHLPQWVPNLVTLSCFLHIYTQTISKSPVDGGDDDTQGFLLSTFTVYPFSPHLACVNQHKLHTSNEDSHVVITSNIHVKRIAEEAEI